MGTVTPFRPVSTGRTPTPMTGEVPMAARLPELVDFLADLLRLPTIAPDACRSETLLAIALGTPPHALRELRRVGLLTPLREGRAFVYSPSDKKRAAVLVALSKLGATRDDLVEAFSPTAARCALCPRAASPRACSAEDCAETLLSRLEARCETEIERLRDLDRLLVTWATGG